MYALYRKELHIVYEPITKNRTCQTWRGKQIAICEEREELQKIINAQKDKDKYFIQSLAF